MGNYGRQTKTDPPTNQQPDMRVHREVTTAMITREEKGNDSGRIEEDDCCCMLCWSLRQEKAFSYADTTKSSLKNGHL